MHRSQLRMPPPFGRDTPRSAYSISGSGPVSDTTGSSRIVTSGDASWSVTAASESTCCTDPGGDGALSAFIEGPAFEPPSPRDIRAFDTVIDGAKVHYHLTGQRGGQAFTDRGTVIDICDSHRREAVLAALQLSAQKWGTFTVHGNEPFRRLCVELAAEHGFKITNPDLQQAIAANRERQHAAAVQERHEPRVASSLAEAYRWHFAEVERQVGRGRADPSRLDAEVAVRLRLTGHHREAIARAVAEGARTLRPQETRNWQTYARRAADFAFGVPGSRLAEYLVPQLERFLRVEGRHLDRPPDSRLGGPLRFDR